MYACPQCGAGLRYDIEKASLFCDHCGHTQDPYSYEKNRDAEESDSFGVTVFVCPQCGGEIMTTDVTAAAFCTYCGASTILDSRMKEEKRPAQIIPFTRTKEDCCNAYRKYTKMALFTPKELRDPDYLSRFRGIYMPYWVYHYDYNTRPTIKGTKRYRKGNYVYTDHYNLTCDLDASYDGITYDASSSFDDSISMAIAPYPSDQLRPFTPAFLSGFFADAPDVDASEYKDFALAECTDDVGSRLLRDPVLSAYEVDRSEKSFERGLYADPAEPRCAYLPVWFLTYRKKDRVAYAVMNGVTGKISADLPVDIRKFLFGSLLLAVPLFFLLNLLMTVTAKTTLTVSSLFASLALLLYLLEINSISAKERREKDLGYLSVRDKNSPDQSDSDSSRQNGQKKSAADAMKRKKMPKAVSGVIWVFLICMVFVVLNFSLISSTGSFFGVHRIVGAAALFISVVVFIFIVKNSGKRSDTANRSLFLHTCGAFAASVAAFVILVLDPADDIIFYSGTILALVGICMTLLGILSKYNLLATRPLPSFFDREGGDDKPVRGYSLSSILPFVIAVPLGFSLLGTALSPVKASASDSGILYQNTGTGYTVTIDDSEDLLSDSEEKLLLNDMVPVTAFGNAVFVTSYVRGSDTEEYAQDYYYNRFGNASGTIFLIDMNNRVLTLQSAGSVYRTITRGYSNTIMDNVYRYASRGNYYQCASAVFSQVRTLLEGGRITQPMKYICNALLALIMAFLFNYAFIRFLMRRKRPSHSQVMGAATISFHYDQPKARFQSTTKVYDPPAKGGHGGGGGSRGGGGGGFSGGGGSHRF